MTPAPRLFTFPAMPTGDNPMLLESFYAAFARADWKRMGECYHPEARFRDEIFELEGRRIAAMWRMLLEAARDFRAAASAISAEGDAGRAHWTADYVFSATGRRVRNEVEAEFEFRDGLIFRHRDVFGFRRWASQALGPAGFFLGWTPYLRRKVRAGAAANLDKFVRAHPEYGP